MIIIAECCASWTCIFCFFLGGSCCCFSKWKTSRFPIISENSAGSFLLASWVAKSLLFLGGVGRDDRSSPKKPGPAWIKEVHWKIKTQQWNPSNRLPNLSINGSPLTVCLHLYHLLGLKKSRFLVTKLQLLESILWFTRFLGESDPFGSFEFSIIL